MAYKTKTGFARPHARVTFDGLLFDPKTGEYFKPKTRTKQSFKAECDINNILQQYSATGMIKHIRNEQPRYADLPDDVDFQSAMNTVIQAESAFASLPSKIRNRFHNDPQEFLAFMADPKNKDEAIELGLVNRPPAEPKPQKVEIVNPEPVQENRGVKGGNPPSEGAKAP